jgi:hypothetical protein
MPRFVLRRGRMTEDRGQKTEDRQTSVGQMKLAQPTKVREWAYQRRYGCFDKFEL